MEKLDPLKSKMSEHHFSEAHFEKSLSGLKNTQESIAGLSTWCLQHKQHHKKIVTCWFKIMKKGKCFPPKLWSARFITQVLVRM